MIALSCIVSNAAWSQMLRQSPGTAADSQARAEMSGILAGLFSDTSAHMRMGPTRSATPADSVRGAAFVVAARAALNQYVDVKLAEHDGYQRAMDWIEEQPIYHYSSETNSLAAQRGDFDATKPVSLLYKKNDRGELTLVGAMYSAGKSDGPAALDALLPTSMAQWHEHVNICYPGGPIARTLSRSVSAATVFWVRLFFNITTLSACNAAGGQFAQGEPGWMTHVYMFSGSDDPHVIWDQDDVGNMDHHMRMPPAAQRP
jgi:hypothetical protein